MEPTFKDIAAAQRHIVAAFKIACINAGITQRQIAAVAGRSEPLVCQVVRGERRSPEVIAAIRALLPSFASEYFPASDDCKAVCEVTQGSVTRRE